MNVSSYLFYLLVAIYCLSCVSGGKALDRAIQMDQGFLERILKSI